MFVARENEAEKRLDRLEQEARRKQVDSALMIRRTDGTAAYKTPPQGTRVTRDPGSGTAPNPAGDDAALLGLMAERINLLERQAVRLETDLRRMQRRGRLQKRVTIAAAVVACAVLAVGVS